MPKSADDLSALFRSLGPDDSSFQATETAAARDAEQRWPLFQAVSPSKSAITPTLSAEERESWAQQEKQVGGERKPALSLPGLSEKLAKSLGRMAGPKSDSDAPVKNLAKRTQPSPSPPPPPPPVIPRVSEASAPKKKTTSARSKPAPNLLMPALEPDGHASVLDVVNSAASEPTAPSPVSLKPKLSDDSLASIFSRLEEKSETISKTSDKKSSFLTRLGKR